MERKSIDVKLTRTPSGAAVLRGDLTDALFRALFQEWAAQGYAAISLERVAARAGAGKAAIYRRWSSKQSFASDAIEAVAVNLTDFGDNGSLEADLIAYLKAARRALRHPLGRRIIPDVFAERMRSADLAAVLDRLATARRKQGHALLDRAISRGELQPTIDRELALDCIPAPLYWRMIGLRKQVDAPALQKQVTVLLVALKAC